MFLFYSLQDIDFDLTNMANILDIPSLRYASPFKKLTRATVDILNILWTISCSKVHMIYKSNYSGLEVMWGSLTSLFFSDMILRVIYDVVVWFVVLQNRITVPLTDVDPYELKYLLPDVSDLYLSLEFSFCKLSFIVPQDMFKTII